MQLIEDRQSAVEDGRTTMSPLMIFPEGSTSNNTHICKFKRGAFESLRSVVPISIQYGCPTVHVADETIADHIGVILMCCCLQPIIAECLIYPVWTPTDYLYQKHGDGSKPKWEIYGDAVREMMCQETGMKPCDQSFRELKQYWKYMTG